MKTKTRVLSWILAICMIAAIIPAAPAQYASAADGVVVYDFIKAANNSGDATLYYFTNSSTTTAGQHVAGVFDNVATYAVTESLGSAPFDIFYAYRSSNCYAGFYKNLGICLYTRNGGTGAEVRMNIKVPESGWYTLNSQVNNGIGTTDGTLRFKLYEGIENTVDPNKIIVESSCKPGLALTTVNFNDGKAIYLDANEKYVVHYASSGAGTKNGNFYIYNLNLTRQYPEITSVDTVPSSVMLHHYTIQKFGVSTDPNAVITSITSDSSAVSVGLKDDNLCWYSADEYGSAVITVTASFNGGNEISKKYYMTVRDEPTASKPVYYYTGATHNAYSIVSNSTANADVFKALSADVTYDSTEFNRSSPWKYCTSYIGKSTSPDNTIFMDHNGITVTSNGTGIVAYISAKLPQSGWYNIDTDFNASYPNQKASFSFFLHDGNNGGLSTKVVRYDGVAGSVYDTTKPVYLSNATDICMLYSLESSSLPAGTVSKLSLRSTTFNAATPNLEAANAVKTSYVIGDAAETVTFAVGAMAPSSVTAVSDNAAVTASVNGADVTFTPAAEGTANVTVSATYGDTTVSKVYTITVNKAKADIPASEIFGKTYAYVKDGSVYFLGGLKVIEGYTKVGFEVAVNGVKADDIVTDQVYTSFVAAGKTRTAAEWDSEYIFITSKAGLSAGDVITLTPYVAAGDVKTYHGELSLELKI